MKGLVFDGKLIFKDDIIKPRPKKDEALIRISLAGICNTDIEITKGYMGFKGILGHEFVGTVEQCTDPQYRGKRVVGEINFPCYNCDYCNNLLFHHCPNRSVLGIVNRNGAFAEYITLPEKNLYIIPPEVSDREAVFIEPLAAGFQILEQVHCKPTSKIAVLGDGKLGLLTALIMRLCCCELLVFGKHTSKLSILEDYGIQTELTVRAPQEPFFDYVIEATGSTDGLKQAPTMIKPRGTIIVKTTIATTIPVNMADIVINEIAMIGSRCGPFQPAIKALQRKLIPVLPLITATYPLEQSIEAFKKAMDRDSIKVLLTM
ncbi:MAG: MDR/zinc-dependent alcohol dehydrogenase-like family protein [bacterium]